MDRNTVIGFFLITVLIIAYTMYNLPTQEQIEQQRRFADSLEQVRTQQASTDTVIHQQQAVAPANTQPHSSNQFFFADSNRKEDFLTLENEYLKIKVSTYGGFIAYAELKKYKTYTQKPLVLFGPGNSTFDLLFFADNKEIRSALVHFQTVGHVSQATDSDSARLQLRADAPGGAFVVFEYRLGKNSHFVDYRLLMGGMDRFLSSASSYLQLDWNVRFHHTEKDLLTERNMSSMYFRTLEGDVDGIGERSTGEKHSPGRIQWVSAKTHFFNSTLISRNGFDSGSIFTNPPSADTLVKDLHAQVFLPLMEGPLKAYEMQYYIGPNNYQELKKTDLKLEKIIPLGSGIFGAISLPINKFFIIPLFNWLDNYKLHYGVIILIMTLVLRILLYPLTFRSFVSAAKMKVLKPEIDELREKYKNDQARFGQEQMNLFRKAGVNPFGGCIPLLLQLPILVAMYTFFPLSIELRQQKLWWADDLSTYDSILELGFHIPFYGSHVSLWTIIMTATSVAFALYNNQLAGIQGPMKWMALLMPVMLLGFFNSLPAALTYYYSVSNVVAFIQQFLIKKFLIDEEAIHRQIQENKKKPLKKSKWQERLEQLQRQQLEKQRQRHRPRR